MSDAKPPEHELVALVGDELRVFPLPERGAVTLGRDEGNDIRIDHPSVSRRHAVVRLDDSFVVEDLGGPNGTFVRDKSAGDAAGKTERLRRLNGARAELAVGESMLLGAVSVRLRRRGEPSAARLVVQDGAMRAVHAQAERAALGVISVLILGETGVGKEVLARSIHARSPRADGPFVGINCAAFSENLLEGELFGYEKGAFTGAVQPREGLFEASHGGTMFLDEVGELPLPTQVKLLRVLEERAVLRIGARQPRPVDTRFIAATNRDVEADVAAGRFRQDLYYRLNGICLTIPPLRERASEIEPLVHSFVAVACRQLDRAPFAVSDEAMRFLRAYGWPGNVRELRNAIERAVVLSTDDTIRPEHLPAPLTTGKASPQRPAPSPAAEPGAVEMDPRKYQAQLDSLERTRILLALEQSGGNQTRAAKLLGVSRRTLVARLDELDLPRPRKRDERQKR